MIMIPAPVYHALSALVADSRHRLLLSGKGPYHCAATWLCSSLAISHRLHSSKAPSLISTCLICMKPLLHPVWFFLVIFILFFRYATLSLVQQLNSRQMTFYLMNGVLCTVLFLTSSSFLSLWPIWVEWEIILMTTNQMEHRVGIS